MADSLRPHVAIVGLGSNLGDRLIHLRRAVSRLSGVARIVRISSIYETAPLDSRGDARPYLNMVAVTTTTLTADDLMTKLLEVEMQGGRRRSYRNAPRTIDLDLILYDGLIRRSTFLALPHPRYRSREFVLAPLRELALTWSDPVTGESIREITEGEGKVRRIGTLY